MQYTRALFKGILESFGIRGGAEPGEEAWVDNDAALTEREKLMRQITAIFQWGAVLNALSLLLLLVLLGLGLVAASQIQGILLAGMESDAATLTLLGLLGIGANVALLLLLSAAVGAQEWWTWILLGITLVLNVYALIFLQFFPATLTLISLLLAAFFMFKDWRAFHLNAVSVKELRGRMRGVRSFAIITVFLLLMGSFVILLYLLQLPRLNATDVIITGNLGQLLFFGVVGVELMLIVFIVPALTAGSISGERERKTYDLLQTTLLSAPAFIMGKMESALGYIALLLLSAIPLQSIAFLFGGVSETEVFVTLILLTATALLLGALGMFFSSVTDKTMSATVRVYTVAIALVFGLPLISFFLFQGAFLAAVNQSGVGALLPAKQEAFMIYGDMLWSSLNPITSAYYTQQMLVAQQQIWLLQVELNDNSFIPVLAPWILTSVIYVGATAWLLLMAVRRMRRRN
jgi:ABC-2 type transport system permease protein